MCHYICLLSCKPRDVFEIKLLPLSLLLSCSFVSRRLNELSKHNPLWKSQCCKHWLLTEWVHPDMFYTSPQPRRTLTFLLSLSLSLYVCSLSDDRLQSGVSWFCLFKQYYTDLGRYIQYYAVLKRAWEQLKSFLQQRCPRMIASLKGVTQQFNSWMHHSSHRYHIVQTGNSQAFCLKGNTKILDF